MGSKRDARYAGAMPKSTPVTIAIAIAVKIAHNGIEAGIGV